jgi:NADH-quinone oxidoreductase subunit M
MLPDGAHVWLNVIAFLCIGNIVYVGLVALRQQQLHLLIGNSSVAHMGFIFLGIASLNLIGITGAVVIMVAHGLLAALTFGLSGYILSQTGTLEMKDLGGLMKRAPFIGATFVIAAMAGCGLPGFANFVGEMMIFFAAWKSLPLATILALWGGLVIGAVYMLRAVRAVVHGPLPDRWTQVKDATAWRKVPFVILTAALLLFGCLPRLLTEKIKPEAERVVQMAHRSSSKAVAQAASLPQIPPAR